MHPNALRFQQEVDSKIYLSEVDPSAKQAIQNTFIGSTTYSAGRGQQTTILHWRRRAFRRVHRDPRAVLTLTRVWSRQRYCLFPINLEIEAQCRVEFVLSPGIH